MHLYLSDYNPWNTNYCNADGQVIYKSEHPTRFTLGSNPIIISRILPANDLTDSENALRDSFSPLAEIDYNRLTPSRIRYNGTDIAATEFLRKTSILSSTRVFTSTDGKEYEWDLGSTVCKLYLKDASKTLTATYHVRKFGLIGNARPASLEIFPQGQHMVDLIVTTFIFVEKLRVDSGLAQYN